MATMTNHKLNNGGFSLITLVQVLQLKLNINDKEFMKCTFHNHIMNAQTCELSGYHEQTNICSSARFFIKDLLNTLLTCCSINRRKVSGDSSSTDFRNSSRIFISKVPNKHSLPRLSKRALFSITKSRDHPSSSSLPPRKITLFMLRELLLLK